MTTRFGPLLCRLRTERTATVLHWQGRARRPVTTTLSQQELARRAGVDAAEVNRLEHGRKHPTRPTVERLAAALELAELDRALLLIAAGYWPWPELSADDTAIAVGVLLAVAEGDYRRVAGIERLEVGGRR